MTADEISVDGDLLRQHAARVDQLATDAAEALAAIGSIDLSGGAFGIMCAWMVPPVAVVSAAVGSAISSGRDLITRSATEIREVAGDFDEHERSVVDAVRSLEAGLG